MPVTVSSQCQLLAVSKTPHAFLSHTTYQIVKERGLLPCCPSRRVIRLLSAKSLASGTLVLYCRDSYHKVLNRYLSLVKPPKSTALNFMSLTIPNPLHPVKLILSLEVIAILSLCATTRRSRLQNPSIMGTHRKERGQVVKERQSHWTEYTIPHPSAEVNTHSQIIQSVVFAIHRTCVWLAHNTYTVKV